MQTSVQVARDYFRIPPELLSPSNELSSSLCHTVLIALDTVLAPVWEVWPNPPDRLLAGNSVGGRTWRPLRYFTKAREHAAPALHRHQPIRSLAQALDERGYLAAYALNAGGFGIGTGVGDASLGAMTDLPRGSLCALALIWNRM